MANSNRGFAAMDPDKQKEIASKGGKASGTHRSSSHNASSNAGNLSPEDRRRGGEHSHPNS